MSASRFETDFNELKAPLAQRMTLANRLDCYFAIYQKCNEVMINPLLSDLEKNSVEKEKSQAMNFIQTVLNIQNESQIALLMQDRNDKKTLEPEYIPGRETKLTSLPEKTKFPKLRRASEIGLALATNKLMPVTQTGLKKDLKEQTKILDSVERDDFRVIIKDNTFQKRKADDTFERFDTSQNVSKSKEGYCAYVINQLGEVSVFDHKAPPAGFHASASAEERLYHSSMKGKQGTVLAAGELTITDGKLNEITASSGHFRPQATNLYETLKYLDQQKVDISAVKIRSHNPIPGLTVIKKEKVGDAMHWIYRSANLLDKFSKEEVQRKRSSASYRISPDQLHDVKQTIKDVALNMKDDLENYEKDRGALHSVFNRGRLNLVQEAKMDLSTIVKNIDTINASKVSETIAQVTQQHDAIYNTADNFNSKLQGMRKSDQKEGKLSEIGKKWEIELGTDKDAKQFIQSSFQITALKNNLADLNTKPLDDHKSQLVAEIKNMLTHLEMVPTKMAAIMPAIDSYSLRLSEEPMLRRASMVAPVPLIMQPFVESKTKNNSLSASDINPGIIAPSPTESVLLSSPLEEKLAMNADVGLSPVMPDAMDFNAAPVSTPIEVEDVNFDLDLESAAAALLESHTNFPDRTMQSNFTPIFDAVTLTQNNLNQSVQEKAVAMSSEQTISHRA